MFVGHRQHAWDGLVFVAVPIAVLVYIRYCPENRIIRDV